MHLRAHQTSVLFLLFVFGIAALAVPRSMAQSNVAVYEVDGLVTDEKATALTGAAIQLLQRTDGKQIATTTTDATGGYKITMVAPGDYVVSATHNCCRRAGTDVTVAGGAALKTTAPTIKLPIKEPVMSGDPVKLSGFVKKTTDQTAVSHVRLEIQSYFNGGGGCSGDVCRPSGGAQYFQVETDGAGAFELDVNRGNAYVRASHDGFDATTGNVAVDKDKSVTVPLRPASDNTVRLSGVLVSDDGKPLAGGSVSAGPSYAKCPPNADCVGPMSPETRSGAGPEGWNYESNGPQYNSTQTQADGSWALRVIAGTLDVVGYAQDHIESHKTVETTAGKDVTVELKLERVPPDSVTITGHVTDRDGRKPLADVQVSIENQKWGSYANAQTDKDGKYELKTKPGPSIMTVRADAMGYVCVASPSQQGDSMAPAMIAPCRQPEPRDQEYFPVVFNIDPAADSSMTRDVKLRAKPSAESTFQGWVLDSSTDKGIANAVVTFYNEDTRDWGSATTDADGSYKIKVHAGYYSVRVWAEHYFDAVANPEIGEKATQTLTVKLAPGEKRYGGWGCCAYAVADASQKGGGAPASGGAAPSGPPTPSDGQKAYEGSPGGLGPYKASAQKGNAPSATALVAMAALAFAALRRRA